MEFIGSLMLIYTVVIRGYGIVELTYVITAIDSSGFRPSPFKITVMILGSIY